MSRSVRSNWNHRRGVCGSCGGGDVGRVNGRGSRSNGGIRGESNVASDGTIKGCTLGDIDDANDGLNIVVAGHKSRVVMVVVVTHFELEM